jgi:hypothetical protein
LAQGFDHHVRRPHRYPEDSSAGGDGYRTFTRIEAIFLIEPIALGEKVGE